MRLGEFQLISAITRKIRFLKDNVLVPAGDDAAVLKGNGKYLFVTSDALVDGTHYESFWKGKIENLYYYLGRKLLSISLSDLASMGGDPDFSVVNIGLTVDYSVEDVEMLYDGLSDCASEFRTSIVGGDTVRSRNEFFDLTLFGLSEKGFMLRRNAVPGDLVGITGTVGDAGVGLEILKGNLKVDRNSYFIDRFLNPTPRVELGKFLLGIGVRCCTDISDGLLFNLSTIAQSSNVAIHVFKEKVPLSDELQKLENGFNYAIYGGEDYELIFTFPERLIDRIERQGLKIVGVVKEGTGIYLDEEQISASGFDHFRGEK